MQSSDSDRLDEDGNALARSSEWRDAVSTVLYSYEREISVVLDCLDRQAARALTAGNEQLAGAYREERERIDQRVAGLFSRAQ